MKKFMKEFVKQNKWLFIGAFAAGIGLAIITDKKVTNTVTTANAIFVLPNPEMNTVDLMTSMGSENVNHLMALQPSEAEKLVDELKGCLTKLN